MVESSPSVVKKAATRASRTARASRLCAGLGDKLERMKCCPSGTTAAVFTIGAPLRGGWDARKESHAAPPLAASARRHFRPLDRLTASKDASRPSKRPDEQRFPRRRI